jgi:hypothetical protein
VLRPAREASERPRARQRRRGAGPSRHLARRFGRLDPNRIKRIVEIALCDRSEYVQEMARSAADDLRTFLSWEFEQ